MNFSTSSFFAGVGTVVVTMALGFGGGVLLTGAFTGDTRPPNKLERQAVEQNQTRPAAVPTPVVPKVPEPQIAAAPSAPSPAAAAPTPPPAAAATPPPAAPTPLPVAASTPSPAAASPPPADMTPSPQAQPTTEPIPTASSQGTNHKPLGAERTVSLVQPPQELLLSRREARALEAKARADRRRAEREYRRHWVDQRRQQMQVQREQEAKAYAERKPQQADDDDDKPVVVRRERPFEPPLFRFFGKWED